VVGWQPRVGQQARPKPPQNGDCRAFNPLPIKHGHFPIKHGRIPIKHGRVQPGAALASADAESVRRCSGHGVWAPPMPLQGPPHATAAPRCMCYPPWAGDTCERPTSVREARLCLNGCSGSWLKVAPGLFEDTALSPTLAFLEALRAPAHSGAQQPWLVGSRVWRQQARPRPTSK
jgi:hypothetical protein